MISLQQFTELATDCNVIPLTKEIPADRETSISLAARFSEQERFFLLESVEGGESWGRFSILGLNIAKEFIIEGGKAYLVANQERQELSGNPIDVLQQYLRSSKVASVPGLPRFYGGLVGYLSFEAVRFFERCGEVMPGDGVFPDAHFMVADQLAVFDNLKKTVKLIYCSHIGDYPSPADAYRNGKSSLEELERLVTTGSETGDVDRTQESFAEPDGESRVDLSSNMTPAEYREMVRKAKRYICDGDIIQVVLAQHFTAKISAAAFDVYRALRYVNPSPYLYFLKLDSTRAIAGSSPEVMVRVTHDRAEIRPIAGTRPRGIDAQQDRELAADLLADAKERAEHVMLVDLARNDLGRVAEIGSVDVVEYMTVEKYSHVMHLVSQVEGRINSGLDAIDVLKASFPAGTLSGAPKVRAMEIINELEPIPRGPYGGALGYIAYGGEVMDMAITIRTVILNGNKATVTAGAGIVYDSQPENEYQETIHKSNGMRRALELAENESKLR